MTTSTVTRSAILGRILWYELLTTDMAAAETFYAAVVGWGVKPFEGSPEPYHLWMRGAESMVGGVMRIPQGMQFPPHWEMYVGVLQLEQTAAKIEQLGGAALSPTIEVPTVGRMRTMKDPQGAVFCIYEPASPPPGPEHEPEIGDASWHELLTTDHEAALTFYADLFKWRPTDVFDMGKMGKYQMFGRAFPLGGMTNKPPEMAHVPPNWGLYFRVADVHAGAERVKANGGQILNGPMEVPRGDWIVNCLDPQGAAFSLHHRK